MQKIPLKIQKAWSTSIKRRRKQGYMKNFRSSMERAEGQRRKKEENPEKNQTLRQAKAGDPKGKKIGSSADKWAIHINICPLIVK